MFLLWCLEFPSHLSSIISLLSRRVEMERWVFTNLRRIIYLWFLNVTIFLLMTLLKIYNYPGIAPCWNMGWIIPPKFSAKILATTNSSTYPRGQTVYCQSFKYSSTSKDRRSLSRENLILGIQDTFSFKIWFLSFWFELWTMILGHVFVNRNRERTMTRSRKIVSCSHMMTVWHSVSWNLWKN